MKVTKNLYRLANVMTRTSLFAVYCALMANVVYGTTAERELSASVVRGTVSRIMGNRIVLVDNVALTFTGTGGNKFETATDKQGRYELSLPVDAYHVLVHWYGDCSQVHRAPFTLRKGDNLTFDFLLTSCRIIDMDDDATIGSTVPGSNNPELSVPLSQQASEYREQVIPGDKNGRPEILVSFGKYDNQVDHIEYFPLDNQIVKNSTSQPFYPMPMPVTVTVDKYTLRGSRVIWHKKAMTFCVTGDVSVSDGHATILARSAILSFAHGIPIVRPIFQQGRTVP